MNTQRLNKISESIRQEISELIQKEVKDPRIGFVTITRVEVTADLRFANVYFSVLGSAKNKKSTRIGLQNAAGFLRTTMGQNLRMRFVPEIRFRFDNSIEYSAQIDEVLTKLKKEKNKI
ncbi:MAG: 30S ribosome-binding factor RbfA [Candidatus Omnitrophota bacterium]|nr:30S ribosome-binding factor RbfA [Candidatus Omnitrophota bacterium]